MTDSREMEKLPSTRNCFGCGRENTGGLRLELFTDGQVVRTEFVPGESHAGFKGIVHGGVLSAVLDELMVWACGVRTRKLAYCGELAVRFLHPAVKGDRLSGLARLEQDRRRIYFASGELRDANGRMIATSTGKYLPIPEPEAVAMLSDFAGGPEELRRWIDLPGSVA